MAQKEKSQTSEGFIDTVRNYIPGLSSSSSPNAEAQTSTASQQGILGYIPGFSSGAADRNNTNTGKADTAPQGAKDTGEVTSPHKSTVDGSGSDNKGRAGEKAGTQKLGEKGKTATHTDAKGAKDFSSAYQGAGIGTKYSSGRHSPTHDPAHGEQSHSTQKTSPAATSTSPEQASGAPKSSEANESNASAQQKPSTNDSLARTQGHSQGSKGQSGKQQGADDGVRGAPIEGENVKGYAVSAPVGSGDTNVRSATGAPSGQVSGAHMQFAPEDTDNRDHLGRGTVGHTKGEGDSSFANVKRNIPYGTEHVVTKSSQSHIEHTSTTQL